MRTMNSASDPSFAEDVEVGDVPPEPRQQKLPKSKRRPKSTAVAMHSSPAKSSSPHAAPAAVPPRPQLTDALRLRGPRRRLSAGGGGPGGPPPVPGHHMPQSVLPPPTAADAPPQIPPRRHQFASQQQQGLPPPPPPCFGAPPPPCYEAPPPPLAGYVVSSSSAPQGPPLPPLSRGARVSASAFRGSRGRGAASAFRGSRGAASAFLGALCAAASPRRDHDLAVISAANDRRSHDRDRAWSTERFVLTSKGVPQPAGAPPPPKSPSFQQVRAAPVSIRGASYMHLAQPVSSTYEKSSMDSTVMKGNRRIPAQQDVLIRESAHHHLCHRKRT